MGIESKTLTGYKPYPHLPQRQSQLGHRHIVLYRRKNANLRLGDYAPPWVKSYSFNPFTNEECINEHRSPFYFGARSYYELPLREQTHVYVPYVPLPRGQS